MNCQFIQLAGTPVGAPAGSGSRAYLSTADRGEQSKAGSISALLGAFAATLAAEETLLAVSLPGPAESVRIAIEAVRGMARGAIEAAAIAPGDAFERVALLRHAVDLEGADGPLVARIAASLALGASTE